jgi:nitrate reductase molybdenum cofactor assembly chaperone NarJ/NarW
VSETGLLALLLQYPDGEVLDARDDIVAAVHESWASLAEQDPLFGFLSWWRVTPAYELQSRYVDTFDLGRRCSLHLTYCLFGDRRERGMALLRLKRRYAAHGLTITEAELPDFLPVMLDYAAMDPDGEVLLNEHRVPLELLRAALHEEQSQYEAVVVAVCSLLDPLTAEQEAQARQIAKDGPPMETVGLEPFAPPEVMPLVPGELRR